MLGLEAGEPVRYSEAEKRWLEPTGPPLRIDVEYESDGRLIRMPAHRWMRELESRREMPELTWVFTGSRIMADGAYAADATGYLVSVVNFDLTVIDIPELASNSNDTLLWQRNPDLVPPKGTPVWMIIEPADRAMVPPATQP
jgi:hypothetical protein